MSSDSDGLPVDRLFRGATVGGLVVALVAFVAGLDLAVAVGLGLFVAVVAVAGGMVVLSR